MFSDLTEALTLASDGCYLREIFQTLHHYNRAQGLAIHTRFDDLDLTSRLQVCQIHQLQIVFRFLSTVV